MRKSFLKYYLPSIVFNVFELIVIFTVGIVFDVKIEHILAIFIAFVLNKIIFGKTMHYKDWYLCLIWSVLLFFSFYLLEKIDIRIAIFSTINFVFLSNTSNIKDLQKLFFWGGNTLNKEVFNWVKFNQDNEKLMKYEKHLKEQNERQKYFIFKYRFREFKSYSEIADLMDMDAQRISEEIKVMSHFIEYSIRLDD